MEGQMTKQMKTTILIEAAPDRIWRALTTGNELDAWLSTSSHVDLKTNGAFALKAIPKFISGPHVVKQLEPNQMLALEWNIDKVSTEVVFRLEPKDGQTAVSVSHLLPKDAPLKVDDECFGECGQLYELWEYCLGLLKTHIELGEAKCRMVHSRQNELKTVEHTLSIKATPEKVFAALTEAEEMKKWNAFAGDAKSDNKVGGRYSFGWEPEKTQKDGPGEIVEYEQDRKLTYTWYGNEKMLVSWSIEPLPGSSRATKLTLVHSGFSDETDIEIGYNCGWGAFLHCLALSVEKNKPAASWHVKS
jgi:uncharacterized protein YndB with AHSA1/START domain